MMRAVRWMVLGVCGLPAFGAVPLACGSSHQPGASATHGGAMSGEGGAAGSAVSGASGGAGGEVFCDCGDDPSFVHVPLDCACRAGLCTTLDFDPKQPDHYTNLGWPYVVLYGTCDDGYHSLIQYEACENGRLATYDPQDRLVYSSSGPYDVAPAACGPNTSNLGDFGIGEEDPARNCSYCMVVAREEGGSGGASGEGCLDDYFANYQPCDPNWEGWAGGGAGGAENAGAGGAH